MSETDRQQRAETRARVRALRDDLIRAGVVRPFSMRDWEVWHEAQSADLETRNDLDEAPDED